MTYSQSNNTFNCISRSLPPAAPRCLCYATRRRRLFAFLFPIHLQTAISIENECGRSSSCSSFFEVFMHEISDIQVPAVGPFKFRKINCAETSCRAKQCQCAHWHAAELCLSFFLAGTIVFINWIHSILFLLFCSAFDVWCSTPECDVHASDSNCRMLVQVPEQNPFPAISISIFIIFKAHKTTTSNANMLLTDAWTESCVHGGEGEKTPNEKLYHLSLSKPLWRWVPRRTILSRHSCRRTHSLSHTHAREIRLTFSFCFISAAVSLLRTSPSVYLFSKNTQSDICEYARKRRRRERGKRQHNLDYKLFIFMFE